MMNGDQPRYQPRSEAFGKWLLAQRGRADWIGSLAIAANQDRAFPRDGGPDEVRKRMGDKGADSDTFEALDDAEREWMAQ